ncbi:Glycosyl hydrolase OS=Kitasatospora aureofaciens OX=1894 GN=GCM10010502_04850 PE=4 SV=1 [Kitasatospora aureofaciens]
MPNRQRRRLLLPAVTLTALGLTTTQALAAPSETPKPRPHQAQQQAEIGKKHAKKVQGTAATAGPAFSAKASSAAPGEDEGDEAENSAEGTAQYTEARTAPGVVAPGAYGAAWSQLQSMPHTGGSWEHVTNKPYNEDDPRYRDVNSNSSGGAGFATGRITGIAADNDGYVYAGGANGGVFRSSTGGGQWKSDLGQAAVPLHRRAEPRRGRAALVRHRRVQHRRHLVRRHRRVRARGPQHGEFQPGNRVGGAELESTIIHALRFGGGKVWAATSRGVWSHSTSTLSGPWTLEFAPNPDYLPGGAKAADASAPYKNIANDIAIDPRDPTKVVLAVGWRGGDTYNGFYGKAADGSWQRVASLGDLPTDAANVGNVTFARSADGSRYYAIDQSPDVMAHNPDTGLKGIYVSKSGSPYGPWVLIADKDKLKGSGSALQGAGYQPGIQAWYNQFLQVDPANPDHVYAGLEEVFETKTAATRGRPRAVLEQRFPCWSIDPTKQTGDCSSTVHSDQHAVAIGSYKGKASVYVGNDGGIYRRPGNGAVDAGATARTGRR